MSWLKHFIRPRIRSLSKRETAEGLWKKCSRCEKMIFFKDMERDLFVCEHCHFHMAWPPRSRLQHLFDEGVYTMLVCQKVPRDPLKFRDRKKYSERLQEARKKTGFRDSVILASGKIHGCCAIAACFDFSFIGGSMGTEAGETLVHASKEALERECPLLVITSSGGARMQEGVLSLMQMPRSIVAIKSLKERGLPFVVLMAHPTTGGVVASFASLGDVTLAEPEAIIGFTGPRVIRETSRQNLPENFQTAEFQLAHGFIDQIVPRSQLRSTLSDIFSVLTKHRCTGR